MFVFSLSNLRSRQGLLQELVSNKELEQDQIEPFKHLNIVGLVGSIDNDMSLTDATIGCYSSLGRICEMVDVIDSTASSHQRAFVIEVMGRHCGWLALVRNETCMADSMTVMLIRRSDGWCFYWCRFRLHARKP